MVTEWNRSKFSKKLRYFWIICIGSNLVFYRKKNWSFLKVLDHQILEELINLKLKYSFLSLIQVNPFYSTINDNILLVYLLMLLNNYQLTKILLVRDHWQITFITLNRFCPLIKKPHLPVPNGKYPAGWSTNQNQMKNTHLFVFQVKVLVIKIYKIQPADLLFLAVTLAFQHISYLTNFYKFIQHYLKKRFSSQTFLF